ncbi:hypothetical protein [Actinoplanes sp. NPDC051851]|uniref:hypothetical protein n=1 Tax=Actinoplanes sp. NPDC051851 TaxID=3154753 RepID=UPI00342F74AC
MSSGDRMMSSAQQIRSQLAAFQAQLSGYGEPWGTDDLGSLIGEVYGVICELAMECYSENTIEIDEVGEGTRVMAVNYLDTEESNADRSQVYLDALGG